MKSTSNGIFFFEKINLFSGVIAFSSSQKNGNMSLRLDKAGGTEKNRKKIAAELGFNFADMVFAQQVHGDKIAVLRKEDAGRGVVKGEEALENTDAMITREKNICPVILSADCVPLVFYDPKKMAVGAVHAGWRGTMLNIAGKTVKSFIEKFQTDPKDLLVGIGPSIGLECFEVGDEVVKAAEKEGLSDFVIKKEGKRLFDLWSANKVQLIEAGVLEKNIDIANICTHCDKGFYSYRRNKIEGRFATGIIISI